MVPFSILCRLTFTFTKCKHESLIAVRQLNLAIIYPKARLEDAGARSSGKGLVSYLLFCDFMEDNANFLG